MNNFDLFLGARHFIYQQLHMLHSSETCTQIMIIIFTIWTSQQQMDTNITKYLWYKQPINI